MKQKILILTAIPHGLRLDREIREIEDAIRRAVRRDLFEIRIRTAVRPQDIRRAIAEERPQIVHFCGHGLEDGSLVLEDDAGKNKPVTAEGLAALFKLHSGYVNCVLLNACHSAKPALSIGKHINYVVGMNQEIKDKAAIAFSQGFYDALGYENQDNQDIFQKAFDEGLVALQLEDISEENIPVLEKKEIEPTALTSNSEVATPAVSAVVTPSVEVESKLNNSDIEILTELLIRSGRAECSARKALCIKIGIQSNRLSFLERGSDADFALQLISYLHDIDDNEALCKICYELEIVFTGGRYFTQLQNLKAKLSCD